MKNTSDSQIVVYSLFFFAICIIIYLCIPDYCINAYKALNYDDNGQIGDIIGGTTSPIIAVIAAYLTFLAFWIQYKANKQQRQDIAVERFESRFYEMIHLHRENLSNLTCGEVSGREAISCYCYKLLIIYSLISHIIEHLDKKSKKDFKRFSLQEYKGNEGKTKIVIAYNLFFYGANYSMIFDFNNKEKRLYDIICHEIEAFESSCTVIDINAKYTEELISITFTDILDSYASANDTDESQAPNKLQIPDKLLCGYNAKLGVYYRQLYHITKFVAQKEGLTETDRYEYMRIVRCQLSDYEQILLYYNSLSPVGHKWNEQLVSPNSIDSEKWLISMGLIARFRLIKNIPSSFIMFGHLPEQEYVCEILKYRKNAPNCTFFESRKAYIIGV